MAQQIVRTQLFSATGAKAITPGTPFDVCRAVLAGTGGAATCTFSDGSVVSCVLVAGYNPIQITNVSDSNLVADDLVALY